MSAILSHSCSRPIFPERTFGRTPDHRAWLVGMKENYGALEESDLRPPQSLRGALAPAQAVSGWKGAWREERQLGSSPSHSQLGQEGGTHG